MARRSTKPKQMSQITFANHQVVVLATYLAGGQKAYADTEDIAIKANEIAPGRFIWRKYKDQINIEAVRKRLWDASTPAKGGYLLGSERDGWLLTQAGLKFCKRNLRRTRIGAANATRYSQREQSWINRERVRMLTETAYQKFATGKLKSISALEAERFFRIDDYVIGAARKTKIQRGIAAFQDDPLLGPATKQIARLVRDK